MSNPKLLLHLDGDDDSEFRLYVEDDELRIQIDAFGRNVAISLSDEEARRLRIALQDWHGR